MIKLLNLFGCESKIRLVSWGTIIMPVLLAGILYPQSTIIKLPKVDTSASVLVADSNNVTLMRLNGDGSLCFLGNTGTGVAPVAGLGTRIVWHPAKAAFRAGRVETTQWDNSNIGYYSMAMGYNAVANGYNSVSLGRGTTASGLRSVALGSQTTASGELSTAMGDNTTAEGYNATAMGAYSTARNDHSVALGYYSDASGDNSIAMGGYAIAGGQNSISMGYNTNANGRNSLATGNNTTASGAYSTALGYGVSTNNHGGSFIIGDTSTGAVTNSSAANQMTMRFAGGYRFFTNDALSAGCTLTAGGNSWSSISDSSRKELFVRANGEYFLNSLTKLKLGSWNYRGQKAKQFRHYGPMAQEIFQYFGKDEYGTIGDETSLAGADMDGIMMICLQALEKRTTELQKANEKMSVYELKIRSLEEKMDKISQMIATQMTNNK